MTAFRNMLLAGVLASAFTVSGCSTFNVLGGADKKREASAAEKAGRIAMVLDEEQLQPNPELATVEIALPEATALEAWPQAGSTAAKSVGHIAAAENMSVAWKTSVGEGTSKSAAISVLPVTNTTSVFTMDAGQTVQATGLENGRKEWRVQLEGLSKRDNQALGGGLAVEGDALIVASGYGFVSRLNTSTGEQVWQRRMSGPMTGAPTIKDGRIFVSSNNNEVFALSLETGEIEWSDQAIAESARVLGGSSPAAVEDFVIAPYSSGEIIAYLASNGRRLWTDAISQSGRFTPISDINDIGSRPILAGGLVFASAQSGTTVAIDGRSGSRVWTQAIGSANAPALVDNYLFVIGNDARLAALNAANGEAFWIADMPQFEKAEKKKGRIAYSGPIVASGRVLVVTSTGELLAFSAQTGEQTGSVKIGDPVYMEPIAAQGKLLILTDDARLVAIQ